MSLEGLVSPFNVTGVEKGSNSVLITAFVAKSRTIKKQKNSSKLAARDQYYKTIFAIML